MPGMAARVLYPDTVACADPMICQEICQSRYTVSVTGHRWSLSPSKVRMHEFGLRQAGQRGYARGRQRPHLRSHAGRTHVLHDVALQLLFGHFRNGFIQKVQVIN